MILQRPPLFRNMMRRLGEVYWILVSFAGVTAVADRWQSTHLPGRPQCAADRPIIGAVFRVI